MHHIQSLLFPLILSVVVCRAGTSQWVKAYCAAPGNECLLQVPLSFIEDPVIANGIRSDMKRSADSPHSIKLVDRSFLLLSGKIRNVHETTATEAISMDEMTEKLYSLFHAKYCLSSAGLKEVKSMFEASRYGVCQRVDCQKYPLLPTGLHDEPGHSKMLCFCGKCRQVYQPPLHQYNHLDGSFFGTTLPHLFFHRYTKTAPFRSSVSYTPRIFGFKLNPAAEELKKYDKSSKKYHTFADR